jgi:hypothetical protein
MIILLIRLIKCLDNHWVEEKSRKYRIYKVHGITFWSWDYILQKKSIIGTWHRVYEEYRTQKGSDTYIGWIKKYNLK